MILIRIHERQYDTDPDTGGKIIRIRIELTRDPGLVGEGADSHLGDSSGQVQSHFYSENMYISDYLRTKCRQKSYIT